MKKLFLIFFLPTFLFGQDVTRTWDDTTLIVENVIVNGLISGVAELEFNTVAQMKAFDFSTVANGARIKCNGYNVANDGYFGPDVFWIAESTATDDGFSVFDPVALGAGRLVRSINGEINVKWAGATGNASTDDSAAFSEVISYVKNRVNAGGFYGTIIYIPIGDYKLTESMLFRNAGEKLTNLKIRGEGGASGEGATRLIFQPTSSKDGFVLKSGFQVEVEGIEFISGNDFVRKLLVLDSEHSPTFSSYNVTFSHCAFRPLSGTTPIDELVRIQNTVQTEFYNCQFSGTDQTIIIGFEPTREFNASADVNTTTENITITAHGFENEDPVTYAEGSGAIGGLTDTNTYYIILVDANTVQLESSIGGGAIDLTSTGTGTASLTEQFEAGGGVGTLVFTQCFIYNNIEVINCIQSTYDNVVFGRVNSTTPVSVLPHATEFFRNENVTFINCSQVSTTASPVDIDFWEQGAGSSGLVVINSRFDGYRNTFNLNGDGYAFFTGNKYNPPTGFTANTITGIVIGANAKKVKIESEEFTGLTAIGAVPIDDNRTGPRSPLVIDEVLGSDFTFASIGSYEIVLTDNLILEGGVYRATWALSLINSASTPNYIVRLNIDGTDYPKASNIFVPPASAYEPMQGTAIIYIEASETAVDVNLTVRQSTGTAGVIKANSITYASFLQLEKL